MARADDISSTERLLDLIRGKREAPVPAAPGGEPAPAGGRAWRPTAFVRKITIGVDLQETELKLAAVRTHSERRRELIQYAAVDMPSGLRRESPAMVRFLRQELNRFCTGFRHFEIWTVITSLDVEARNVRIPKVPPKEVANAVYWNMKKEVPVDDARVVFDYEIIRTVQEGASQKMEALAYTAPQEAVDSLRQVFARAGYPLTGISIVPFGIQNLFRSKWIDDGEDSVCTLFVGRDWSRIDLFAGETLVLSRDIKTGLQSMAETLREALEQQSGAAPEETGETAGLERAREILDAFLAEESVRQGGGDTLEHHPVFQMVRPALDRVVRQVERTIQHYALKIGERSVRRVYISGQMAEHPALVGYIGAQVGLPIAAIDPFPEELTTVPRPEEMRERGAFLPAVGMALSQQYQTPNFIFTYRHKERQRNQARVNRMIFVAFLVMMAAGGGFSFWQDQRLGLKKDEIQKLQTELDSYVPRVDQNLLLQMAAKVHDRVGARRAFAEKHLAEVVLAELGRDLPEAVRLTNVVMETVAAEDAAPGSPPAEAGGPPAGGTRRIVLIEGLVVGPRVELEPALADLMMRLGGGVLFDRPVIRQKVFESLREGELMRFSLQMDVV